MIQIRPLITNVYSKYFTKIIHIPSILTCFMNYNFFMLKYNFKQQNRYTLVSQNVAISF